MTRPRLVVLRPGHVGWPVLLTPGRPVLLTNLLLATVPSLVVLALVSQGSSVVLPAAEVLLGAGAVALVARHPASSVFVLVLFVPLQLIGLSLLFRLGVPGGVIKAMGGAKDVIALGLVAHVLLSTNRVRRKLDLADRFGLLLLVLIVLYLVAPSVVPGLLGSSSLHVRLLAARENGLFVLAFLAIRRANISPEWSRRIVRSVVALAFVMCIGAIVNVALPDVWSSFLTRTVHLPWYNSLITGAPLSPVGVLTKVELGGHLVVRASSLLSSALVLGFYLLPAFAICLHQLANRRFLARYVSIGVLCAAAIVATATRSAILAAIVTAAVVARLTATHRAPGWLRLLFLLIAAAIVVAPIGASTTAGQRVTEATSGQDTSAQGHLQATQQGIDDLAANPLGRGLGTAPSIGERFQVKGHLTTEDAYLQVGNEIGLLSMLAFIGFLLSAIVALARQARVADPNGLATAMCAAGVGLAVGGFFLHIWLDYATALTFWALAGLALNSSAQNAFGKLRAA